MNFNKHNFSIKEFCSKDEHRRPEFTGVFVSPKETCATDSFILVRVDRDPEEQEKLGLKSFKPFILPKDKAGEIARLFNKKDSSGIVILMRDKEMVEIGKSDPDGSSTILSKTIKGKFPDYKKLMSEEPKSITFSVNAKFLKKIAMFFNSFSNDYQNKVEISVPLDINKNQEAIRFRAKRVNGQKAEALLMPFRD